MKNDFQITVIFDPEIILETKSKADKIIYSKNPDEKKKNKLIEKLQKKAAEDSLKFNRRRLSSLFAPVFSGCILFSGGADLTGGDTHDLIDFGDAFFGRIEENFGIDIVNYSLIDLKSGVKAKGRKPNVFDFEIFNYNFDTHRAVKSEFVKIPNVKKISKIAETVLAENKSAAGGKAGKKTTKPTKEKPAVKTVKREIASSSPTPRNDTALSLRAQAKQSAVIESEIASSSPTPRNDTTEEKPALKTVKQAKGKSEGKKRVKRVQNVQSIPEVKTAPEVKIEPVGEITEICEPEYAGQEKNIGEQIDLISRNWSLLSPSENIPVLEAGEPVEISGESLVRIYFQKPSVRQVVWRFRKKPEAESSKPILRVYKDVDMLWYEVLDGHFGSRYIIFPEELELSQTWVEIGYLTEKGGFIFIARSPAWPPACLLQKLPKLKLKRNISKDTVLIGATESIPGGRQLPVNITSSGAGFSASGAGFTASGEGIKQR